MKSITYFWKRKVTENLDHAYTYYFWKGKATENLGHAYAYTRMHMHAQALRTHTRVLETMKGKFFAFKTWFGTNPTSFSSRPKPLFFDYIKP